MSDINDPRRVPVEGGTASDRTHQMTPNESPTPALGSFPPEPVHQPTYATYGTPAPSTQVPTPRPAKHGMIEVNGVLKDLLQLGDELKGQSMPLHIPRHHEQAKILFNVSKVLAEVADHARDTERELTEARAYGDLCDSLIVGARLTDEEKERFPVLRAIEVALDRLSVPTSHDHAKLAEECAKEFCSHAHLLERNVSRLTALITTRVVEPLVRTLEKEREEHVYFREEITFLATGLSELQERFKNDKQLNLVADLFKHVTALTAERDAWKERWAKAIEEGGVIQDELRANMRSEYTAKIERGEMVVELQDKLVAMSADRDGLDHAISEANWLLSNYVDAGGGTKALLVWAKLSNDWHKVSCHVGQPDGLKAEVDECNEMLDFAYSLTGNRIAPAWHIQLEEFLNKRKLPAKPPASLVHYYLGLCASLQTGLLDEDGKVSDLRTQVSTLTEQGANWKSAFASKDAELEAAQAQLAASREDEATTKRNFAAMLVVEAQLRTALASAQKDGERLERIRIFMKRYSWNSGQDVRDEIREILHTGHDPLCDYVSDNPEGILKPCNCAARSSVASGEGNAK